MRTVAERYCFSGGDAWGCSQYGVMTSTTRQAERGPIKLAFCITELDVGGAERCLTELVTRIDRRRFEPTVYVLAAAPGPKQRALVARLEATAVDIHFLQGRSWRDAPQVLNRLTRKLRRQCPALVQTFLFHANLLGRVAGKMAGVPHVVCGVRVAERRHRWHLRADAWTSRHVSQYICVSRAVARFSEQTAGLPASKITVIGNGVDVDRFRTASPIDLTALGVPAGQRVLVHVGRLDPQKRVDWLLRVTPQIMANWPSHDLVLVGHGSEEKALRRLADQLGIAPRVHFVGFRDDVPQILAASDALLLSSGWEGMPNSLLEAMAAGLPVVATDVEGVRELLGPLAERQCVGVGEMDSFRDRLDTILADENVRRRLGAENQRRAEAFFSIDVMVREYERTYDRLLRAETEAGQKLANL